MGSTYLSVGVYNAGTESIDWINRYQYTSVRDLVVIDGLGKGTDTMTWKMRFGVDFVQGGSELPLGGQIVRLVVEDVKVFEGVITAPSNRWLSGGISIEVDYAAAGYILLLDRHLVIEQDMPEVRAGARVTAILSEYASDFAADTSHIAVMAPYVPIETYDYQSVSSVITNLANRVGYMWYLDYNKAVHFFADLEEDAPIAAINADTDMTVGDLEITSDAGGVINVVILKDFASKSTKKYTHETTADGNTTFFSLPMGPFDIEDTEVYVRPEGGDSWVEYLTVADPLDGRPESISGVPGMAYICLYNWGARFPTVDFPYPGDQVKVEFYPELPDRVVVVFDEDSIREFARREGGDGHHEMTISVSDFRVADDSPVEQLGQLILTRKAWPLVTGTLTLNTTNIGEWAPGETFTVISVKRDIFDVRAWVASNYVTKSPQRVWVTQVERRFEVTDTGIREFNRVSFTSQPWEG